MAGSVCRCIAAGLKPLPRPSLTLCEMDLHQNAVSLNLEWKRHIGRFSDEISFPFLGERSIVTASRRPRGYNAHTATMLTTAPPVPADKIRRKFTPGDRVFGSIDSVKRTLRLVHSIVCRLSAATPMALPFVFPAPPIQRTLCFRRH